MRRLMAVALGGLLGACGGRPVAPTSASAANEPARSPGRGFPEAAPWVSFYGSAAQMGDLDRAARTFRILNIEADPDVAAFSPAEIRTLQAGGRNRVISYLNVGACEQFRSYWASAPPGLVPCRANTAAQLGPYEGYPDEVWMNPANADYQRLILEHVAPRLAAQGVDGFFLDNLELLEHGEDTANGPCDEACAAGGVELVRRLRSAYPGHLVVMQNATSDAVRLARTSEGTLASLLDGISRESAFAPALDGEAEAEMLAWRDMGLLPGGRPFWIGSEDYVGSCNEVAEARRVYAESRARGFSPYATDASAGQQVVCYWPF